MRNYNLRRRIEITINYIFLKISPWYYLSITRHNIYYPCTTIDAIPINLINSITINNDTSIISHFYY